MASSTSAAEPKRLPFRLRLSTSAARRRRRCNSCADGAEAKSVAHGKPDVGADATSDGIDEHLKWAVESFKLPVKSPPIRLGQISSAAAALLAEQLSAPEKPNAPEKPIAGTAFSAPAPALPTRKWLLLAAIVGFAVSCPSVSTFWEREASEHSFELASSTARPMERRSELPPRLVAHHSQGIAGQPVRLGLTLRGAAHGGVVTIAGLVHGMTLSSGRAFGADEWQVPATDLDNTWIGPPVDFAGAVELTAELRLADATIVQREAIRVEWTTPSASGMAQASTPADPERVATTGESAAGPAQVTTERESTAEPEQATMESASAKWQAIRQCWSIGQLVESSPASTDSCR